MLGKIEGRGLGTTGLDMKMAFPSTFWTNSGFSLQLPGSGARQATSTGCRGWVGWGLVRRGLVSSFCLAFIKVRYNVLEKRIYSSSFLRSQWVSVMGWAEAPLKVTQGGGHSICPRGLRKGLSD